MTEATWLALLPTMPFGSEQRGVGPAISGLRKCISHSGEASHVWDVGVKAYSVPWFYTAGGLYTCLCV